jgi:hypothetical protein
MVEHHVAHDAPPQARSPAQRNVDVGGTNDPIGDKVVDFARERSLQAISNMPGDLLKPIDVKNLDARSIVSSDV